LGPRRSETVPWLALGALLVVLAAAAPFIIRAWLAQRARARQRSAYDLARAQLQELLAAPLPGPEQMDAFFVALSGIVRRYLEDRFWLRSPELTTEEFLDELSGSPDLSSAHQDLLRDFLRRADLVKFAHVIPDAEDVQDSVRSARRFLDETRASEPLSPTATAPARTEPARA
jgi:hypothetical protein